MKFFAFLQVRHILISDQIGPMGLCFITSVTESNFPTCAAACRRRENERSCTWRPERPKCVQKYRSFSPILIEIIKSNWSFVFCLPKIKTESSFRKILGQAFERNQKSQRLFEHIQSFHPNGHKETPAVSWQQHRRLSFQEYQTTYKRYNKQKQEHTAICCTLPSQQYIHTSPIAMASESEVQCTKGRLSGQFGRQSKDEKGCSCWSVQSQQYVCSNNKLVVVVLYSSSRRRIDKTAPHLQKPMQQSGQEQRSFSSRDQQYGGCIMG